MRHDLAKWEPVSDIVSLQDEMNRLFLDFFGRAPGRRVVGDSLWAPVMDIEETKDDIIIKAEIPGMTKEDVKIQVSGDIITISGERKREEETRDKTYHRIERSYGQFQRMITLPGEVQSAKAKASYENGVLTIKLPKSEEVKPKEISIDVK
ncbi:MAG: Hsp20/alpha crystallin family protein [Candidatus Edwardsbacteria bacterium]|nr:Hsp20/alpha crystallin family protein [Candidatus Edwardsbacteria bacterium]